MTRFIFYTLVYLHTLFAMQIVEGLKDAEEMVDRYGKEQADNGQ